MTLKKNIRYKKESRSGTITSRYGTIKLLYLSFLVFFFTACTDFVEVDLPNNQLAAEAVFEDSATVTAALAHIYAQMRDVGMMTGHRGGLSFQIGFYADELDYYSSSIPDMEFYNHTMLASNTGVTSWWNNAYNLIYAANAIVEGVENSINLSLGDQDQFKGEGLFIRAYLHSLLVELYGDIPYISTTDYLENTTVARMSKDVVYEHIITDLTLAAALLPDEDISGERVRPYAAVANALLARVYIYTEQWEESEVAANKSINTYVWEPDLNKVFLKDASSTLWQFKPEFEGDNTQEANAFIFVSLPPGFSALSNSLLDAFEAGDQRRALWIGSVTDGIDTFYYPFKYKERFLTGTSVEYSILFRLVEQYLIRAEARAHLGNISGAQQDLNTIRTRAGLADTNAATMNDLLDAVLQERRVELFTEFGHRWFDLKRTGNAANVLAPIKPGWQATDILLPIPEAELLVNPNLLPQNDGY